MQGAMALVGASDVYSEGVELLERILNVTISESQLYRVTHCLGEQVAADLEVETQHPTLDKGERVYASIDGSMIQMDSGWQEVKLGRLFRESVRVENGIKGKNKIRYRLNESTYSAHLGAHTDFIPKFEASLGNYKKHETQLVFITDGAQWIQNYLTQRFPRAMHILDYYHAAEHLADFAKLNFEDSVKRKKWFKKQKDELLEGSVQRVINNLLNLTKISAQAKTCRLQLIEYYRKNENRMNYKSYRDLGLLIGSGPMEAAHRTVIQTRMKRSGQRWTPSGAKAMLNLRVLHKSKKWDSVDQLFKRAA